MFQKAERKKVKLKIALTGPSGAGKTLSALYLASGIGEKIALIDTENESASLYQGFKNVPEFFTVNVKPPYTIEKYIEAMKAAIKQGFDVLVVDSISHAWAGEGGILDKKAVLDSRPNSNSYTNWNSLTPEQEKFKAAILNLGIDMVCTMRSKQDYILVTNDKGRQAPQKVGMAPIQREGMEYEFTTVFDIAMDNRATVSKDRTGLWNGLMDKLKKEHGEKFAEWRDSGKDENVVAPGEEIAGAPHNIAVNTPEFLNEYVVEFGKFKGKRLTEITDSEIASYMEYLTSEAMKQNKEIKGAVRNFLDFGCDYLEFKKKQSNILDESLPH